MFRFSNHNSIENNPTDMNIYKRICASGMLFVFAALCGTPSANADDLVAGKKKCYYAACSSKKHPGAQHWYGSNRSTQKAAKKDADAHKKSSGHSDVGVLPCFNGTVDEESTLNDLSTAENSYIEVDYDYSDDVENTVLEISNPLSIVAYTGLDTTVTDIGVTRASFECLEYVPQNDSKLMYWKNKCDKCMVLIYKWDHHGEKRYKCPPKKISKFKALSGAGTPLGDEDCPKKRK